jgi:hypothetical protein
MACLSAGQLPAGEEYRKEPVAAKVQGHVDSKPLTEMLSAYKTKPSLQNAALLLEGICGFSVKVEDGGLVFRYMTDSVGKENRISPVLARLGKERDAVIVGMLSTIVAAGEKVDRKDPDSCLGFSDEISSLVAYLRGQFRGNIQVDKASAVLTEAQLAEQTHDAAVFIRRKLDDFCEAGLLKKAPDGTYGYSSAVLLYNGMSAAVPLRFNIIGDKGKEEMRYRLAVPAHYDTETRQCPVLALRWQLNAAGVVVDPISGNTLKDLLSRKPQKFDTGAGIDSLEFVLGCVADSIQTHE